ncbi:sulfate ABC transporter substrate-binding protein [Acinetobacter larvae]|uniref:ABC transporter permease n=1 Tax=Acinetobacter larvae TaxID=1789224 RepID=A0A1B2LXL4_9GAMM|nr:sulfate ABC transporter substrate-binding protein [Acinetobacter larvae]AOA57687.1 ABC transporter permease [Acinetobacter larvae]
MHISKIKLALVSALLAASSYTFAAKDFLNVSYDPTRELYDDVNKQFSQYWQSRTGQQINFKQSHGGSGKQARGVIDGLSADVVTLALAADIDAIADKTDLLPKDWQKKFPNNSTPYTSTIVFLVRKGNPKQLKDWNDLVKPGVEIITPNPKTSGGARWNYLAAWAWAKHQYGSDAKAQQFVTQIYKQTKVLDSGARGATTTFTERGIGDVLLAWENEAYLAVREQPNKFEIITPSLSILAEPPVAIVEKNAQKHGNQNLARGYLNFLYSPRGQDIAARHYYRPRNENILKQYQHVFKPLKLVTIDQEFGGWVKVQKQHFDNNGIFDQIIKTNNQK